MEEDDDFGDLYRDVFQPQLPPPPTEKGIHHGLIDSDDDDVEDEQRTTTTTKGQGIDLKLYQTLAQPRQFDCFQININHQRSANSPRVLEGQNPKNDVGFGDDDVKDINFGIEEVNEVPMIHGVSIVAGGGGSGVAEREEKEKSGGGEGEGQGDEWDDDSDSDDGLQIVLDDNGPVGMGMRRNFNEEDDGEDDLVILTDGDHHQHGGMGGMGNMEETDWGEEGVQVGESERKDGAGGDAAKAAVGGGGNVVSGGARVGYNAHSGYHPHQFHNKYVRPGAPVSVPGQIRPFMGSNGRGRGEWRPPMQKNFQSGYGVPVWGNNSAGRGFGSGLEFTLPSYKTAFDIDIESFEEKPWRYPGVDISDYFNFGLDEEKWKDYCKQLEQLRLEATMQSRIRVYESGRSEQDYDPDLPPELAAAAGIQGASVEHANLGKVDGGQGDLVSEGRGDARVRPPLPTGRAIQVEAGYGERLPSADTRPPRLRDTDAIIEIVLVDSADDDLTNANGSCEHSENEKEDDIQQGSSDEDIRRTDNERADHITPAYNGRKKNVLSRRDPFRSSISTNDVQEEDRVLPLPQDTHHQYHPSSKGQTLTESGGTSHDKRGSKQRKSTHERYSHLTPEHEDSNIRSQDAEGKHIQEMEREKSVDGTSVMQTSGPSSPDTDEAMGEKLDLNDDVSFGILAEDTEMITDMAIAGENFGDKSPFNSAQKKKLSSRVEESSLQGTVNEDDLRTTHSSDTSKARSGSSRDYQKRRDVGDEEDVQEGPSRRRVDIKRRHRDVESNVRREDDYIRDGRQEMIRNHVVAKRRETSVHSLPHREWDPNLAHTSRIRIGDREIDRPRENWQKREEDMLGMRVKDEEIRKRDRVEEMSLRPRNKVRENDRFEKEEHLHSRKRLDNGDLRGHYDKDVGDLRGNSFVSRHENFGEPNAKRRKDEEHHKREQVEKEGIISRRKRERVDGLDERRREDHPIRVKDNRQRFERDGSQRLKQAHDDTLSNREREERGTFKSGRGFEDKSWVRSKDESRGLVSDKRRHIEQPKRNDRAENDSLLQHRVREPRQHQFNNEDRYSRHDRSRAYSDHPMSKDDHNAPRSEKVSMKAVNDQERDSALTFNSRAPIHSRSSSSMAFSKRRNHEHEAPQQRHSSRKHMDALSDDEQQDSKKGRSKLERWTSHKDRDADLSFLKAKTSATAEQPEEVVPIESLGGDSDGLNNPGDFEIKDADIKETDKLEDDRHLNTVAKLKKRSERFKTPIATEKETSVVKKLEIEAAVPGQAENATDSEVKPERPARKRRW